MAAIAALQSAMASLSFSSSSVLGNRVSPFCVFPTKPASQPCAIVMQIRHWEREQRRLHRKGKRLIYKVHVKIGDTVKVMRGKDKGRVGEIHKIYRCNGTVLIKGINYMTKHVKPTKHTPGHIAKIEAPIHSSNVMLYSKVHDVVSRVGHTVLENGKKVRVLKKTGEVIDTDELWRRLRYRRKGKAAAGVATKSLPAMLSGEYDTENRMDEMSLETEGDGESTVEVVEAEVASSDGTEDWETELSVEDDGEAWEGDEVGAGSEIKIIGRVQG